MRTTLTAALIAILTFGTTARAQPTPESTTGGNHALVIGSNEGNVDIGIERTLLRLLVQAFHEHGIEAESALENTARKPNPGERLFILHILQLDSKNLLQLEERAPDGPQTLFMSSLVPGDIATANEAVPRLTDSVLRRIPATDTALVSNVTEEEAGTHNRGHFVLSITGGSNGTGPIGGLGMGYEFETPQFAIGAAGQFVAGNGGAVYASVYGKYYLTQTAISPYVGAGLGYGGEYINGNSNAGGLVEAEVGVEVMRFTHTHVDVGLKAIVPLFSVATTDDSGNATTTYAPIGLLSVRVPF